MGVPRGEGGIELSPGRTDTRGAAYPREPLDTPLYGEPVDAGLRPGEEAAYRGGEGAGVR